MRAAPELLAVGAAALFAAAVNAYYGPRGFMPLDHSVVFDGGWRTLEGQVPFRDYTTPNAITPSLLQALFFWAFGVTWKAYVLHATVFNALVAVIVYVLLRLCGGSRLVAALYGALSGLVFYPPVGVPFHDQHAFFFVLLGITLAVAARRAGSRTAMLLWALVPFALAAAVLSKQTPTLLGAPVVLGLAFAQRSAVRRTVAALTVGSAASIGLVVAAGFLARVDWQLARVYLVELPLETGESRGRRGVGPARPFLVLAALLLLVGLGLRTIGNRAQRRTAGPTPTGGIAVPLALSVAFILMCGAFIVLTLNEALEGMPLFFAGLGLFHVAAVRAVAGWRPVGRVPIASGLGVLLACFTLLAAWNYNIENDKRIASNIVYDETLVQHDLPASLSSMHFQVPVSYRGFNAADLRHLESLLESRPGGFVHLGDTSIVNGLAGMPSVFPALFFSVGLTIPKRGTEELARFEERLFERMEEANVRRVVVERRTWEGGSIRDLPRFEAWLARCGRARQAIGFFAVIEVPSQRKCS